MKSYDNCTKEQLIAEIESLKAIVLEYEKPKILENHIKESLSESKRRLSTLMENLPGMVYRCKNDSDWTMEFVSDGCHKLTGYKPADLMNNNLLSYSDIILMEDRDEVWNQVQSAISKQKPFQLIYRILTSDRKQKWVWEQGQAVYDANKNMIALEGFISDISELKLVESELKKSEEKYRSILENMIDGYYRTDKEGIVILSSPSVEEITGFDKSEINGKKISSFFTNPDDRKQFLKKIREKGSIENYYGEIRTKRNKNIFVETNSRIYFDENEKYAGIEGIFRNITERKNNEAAIAESEKNYRLLFENSPFPIFTAKPEGTIVELNENAKELLVSLFEEPEQINLIDYKLLNDSGYAKYFLEVCKTGKTIKFEMNFKSKLNKTTILSVTIVPFKNETGEIDKIYTVAEDISSQKKSIEDNKKLSVAVEQSPAVIAITDTKGNIEYVNPKFTELSGYSLDEVVGENPRIQKTGYQSDEVYKDLWETISSGKTWRGEFHNKKKNGESFWESASISPIFDSQNNIINYVKVAENITDRKKAEEEIRQQNNELQERNEELNSFSHTVAHDLKNPLGSILGFSNLLITEESDISIFDRKNYLQIIETTAHKMNKIIDSLLLLASVRKSDVVFERLNMNKVLAESLNRIYSMKIEANASINAPETLPVVLGNPQWIEEVWMNYLSNALKYGGESPKIDINYEIIKSEKSNKKMVRFSVRDFGPGISEENQKLLFNKFERLNQLKSIGYGLGLSIVRRIVEKQGGEVGVESKNIEGEGSTFHFSLQYDDSGEDGIISETKNSVQNKNFNLCKLKVLIVEDDFSAEIHICMSLQNICGEILFARTGIEALKICINNPDIDLILMDINMPTMDGYVATQQIRDFDRNVVIIAQTVNTDEADRKKALEAGCNDYITKPIDKDVLIEMLHKHFDKL
ncbi:MAG: PAS domain S-box protein [Bacteroidetes bacterium]|jgi:PAS domain S-box-containing protein|nr:PAS domain S-box protein [Bacteroidota bacterium]MBT6685093.1 PAS domain S-box protein [Bacteroidota bacterium]MBT7141942.1 PAS domain S-box protein [Bacteroidota bacterium]MBT7491173.1 PAS domain S-box protein [Bacteroidota bacterium]